MLGSSGRSKKTWGRTPLETSGRLLVLLVSSYRYEGAEVNMKLAKSEAKILHEKISDKAYNDEELIRILATRSKAQLVATLNLYNNEFGNSINKDLKSDPKDEYLAALRGVIRCICCPEKYLEKVIRMSIDGLGTDENALTRVITTRALTRVITTRAEVDLKVVKGRYTTRGTARLLNAQLQGTLPATMKGCFLPC